MKIPADQGTKVNRFFLATDRRDLLLFRASATTARPSAALRIGATVRLPTWFHRAGIERPKGASAQRGGQTGRAPATRAEERSDDVRGEESGAPPSVVRHRV